jgi:hypothetical protein
MKHHVVLVYENALFAEGRSLAFMSPLKWTYQNEQCHEAPNVTDHPTQRELEGPKVLKGSHDVGDSHEGHDVSYGEQTVRHNLRIVRVPP